MAWELPAAVGIVTVVDDGLLMVDVEVGKFTGWKNVENSGPLCLEVPGQDTGIMLGVPVEVTASQTLSYKEFVSSTPLKPKWFCSHFWGEPVLDFVPCVEEHSLRRGLDDRDTGYWICAYANRQYDLKSDIAGDVRNTSFYKAMRLADGVLLFLDQHARSFARIWCCFEIYTALSDEKKLDLVTVATTVEKELVPVLLADGQLPGENLYHKNLREAQFPMDVLVTGILANLEDGAATVEEDRAHILEAIDQVEHANDMLHAHLACAIWSQAVKRGVVESIDGHGLRLPDVLRKYSEMVSLNLSLANLPQVTDIDVSSVARGLPSNLKELELNFQSCKQITNAGVQALALNFPLSLESLKLNFIGCVWVSDRGLMELAMVLAKMKDLHNVQLDFANCKEVSPVSLRRLAECLPRRCNTFSATFIGTEVGRNFATANDLRRQYLGFFGTWFTSCQRTDIKLHDEYAPLLPSSRSSFLRGQTDENVRAEAIRYQL